jgi:hypothetical protein
MTAGALRPVLVLAAVLGALVFCGAGQAKTGCVSTLLRDWRDGRIDGTYSVECYQSALAQLPEDLRIYSSAESDIKRALLARSKVALSAPAKAQKATVSGRKATASGGGQGVSPLLVLAIAGAVLAAMGSVFVLVR